jgi:site-specific recombinase XerD
MNEETAIAKTNNRLPTQGATEKNPAEVYLAALALSGRRSMRSRLNAIAAHLGHDLDSFAWSRLRFEHVAALITWLQETGRSPGSVNAFLYALRGVAFAAWRLRQMDVEDYQRIKSIKGVGGSRLPAGRALAGGEVSALLDACARDETPAGARDAAMLALLVGAGLRRSEAAALNFGDYDGETGALKVRGKGDKERLAYLESGAAAALADWLFVRGESDGALLHPVRKGGEIMRRRMTAQAIYDALAKRAREAKLSALSPHDLRRTFVSELLDAGADISAVQQLAGHANVQTTTRYDRRGEAAKRKAVALIHLPYRSRFARSKP